MEKTNLYIPQKCKVGLQLRKETYTGKLGYIIYNDGKVWRKETSWESWRHNEGQKLKEWNFDKRAYDEIIIQGVEPIEFDNVPTEGFVLNKKAGGYSTGWNHRQTYCRIYDPRGWEFEITIPNLLYILQECSSYKGKGLEGEFVYSWEEKNLVLLPVSSPDYKECQFFTNLQSQKIYKKDLVEGCTYLTSKMEKLIYLGYHKVCEQARYLQTEIEKQAYGDNSNFSFKKIHIFLNERYNEYVFLTSLNTIKSKVSDEISPKFADYIDDLQKSEYYSEPDRLEIIPFDDDSPFNSYYDKIYKFGKIEDAKDLVNSKRMISISKNEENKWDISIQDTPFYTYMSKLITEKTLTKEEIKNRYGYLCRVYKNGFKKLIK